MVDVYVRRNVSPDVYTLCCAHFVVAPASVSVVACVCACRLQGMHILAAIIAQPFTASAMGLIAHGHAVACCRYRGWWRQHMC
jgi:hypothetical protein